jgi:hypothetical protein
VGNLGHLDQLLLTWGFFRDSGCMGDLGQLDQLLLLTLGFFRESKCMGYLGHLDQLLLTWGLFRNSSCMGDNFEKLGSFNCLV